MVVPHSRRMAPRPSFLHRSFGSRLAMASDGSSCSPSCGLGGSSHHLTRADEDGCSPDGLHSGELIDDACKPMRICLPRDSGFRRSRFIRHVPRMLGRPHAWRAGPTPTCGRRPLQIRKSRALETSAPSAPRAPLIDTSARAAALVSVVNCHRYDEVVDVDVHVCNCGPVHVTPPESRCSRTGPRETLWVRVPRPRTGAARVPGTGRRIHSFIEGRAARERSLGGRPPATLAGIVSVP